jgi:hypothetical protein|tara:strand:- start:1149 stop:1355 length:207 start_codon:yes stop_codon:yes gene_type:complete
MLDNSCFESTITSHEYPTYYDCALSGYKLSHNTLMKLDPGRVEEAQLAVKYECRGVKVHIIPPQKPNV